MFKTEPIVTCNAHTMDSLRGVIRIAKEVGNLAHNNNLSDEEFKRTATTLLTKMFASI